MFKKVVVGVSGGVDSAVAALLLKSRGLSVTGVFMKNWDQVNEFGECQIEQDLQDAKLVCDQLKIPFVEVNFVKDYWNEVFSNLLESYEIGKTPVPDIECNKKIKFDKFFNFARSELGADAIATGHYARSSFGPYLEYYSPEQNAALLKAQDPSKDQTFFLSQMPQESLKRTMFPLGDYLKSDVRIIAREANLFPVMDKKESMGICFIGKREFKDFIVEYVENKPGNFVDAETGKVVGEHNGIHQWTLGQRCKISGKLHRYFVFRKDVDKNIIYAVAGKYNPALFSEFLITTRPHWIKEEPCKLKNGCVLECEFRFQHQHPLVPCTVYKTDTDRLLIKLLKPLKALTPGQFAVFYSGDECLGSAEITYPGPPLSFCGKEVSVESHIESMEILASVASVKTT